MNVTKIISLMCSRSPANGLRVLENLQLYSQGAHTIELERHPSSPMTSGHYCHWQVLHKMRALCWLLCSIQGAAVNLHEPVKKAALSPLAVKSQWPWRQGASESWRRGASQVFWCMRGSCQPHQPLKSAHRGSLIKFLPWDFPRPLVSTSLRTDEDHPPHKLFRHLLHVPLCYRIFPQEVEWG